MRATVVYLFPGTGKHRLPLPGCREVPSRRGALAGLSWPTAKPACVEIDTDDEGLHRLAWARAADGLIRRPPGCPLPCLEEVWGQWLKIACELAYSQPKEMEEWMWAILGQHRPDEENIQAITALTEMLVAWRGARQQTYQDSVEDISRLLVDHDEASEAILAALTRVFVWRKDASVDASPGLLEGRWIHWPLLDQPLLSLHLTHPAAVAVTEYYCPPRGPLERDWDSCCRWMVNRYFPPSVRPWLKRFAVVMAGNYTESLPPAVRAPCGVDLRTRKPIQHLESAPGKWIKPTDREMIEQTPSRVEQEGVPQS